MSIDRFMIPQSEGCDLPAHLRTAYVREGVAYLPLEPFGGIATLAAVFDGLEVIEVDGHAYAPIGWLKGVCVELFTPLDAVEANLLRQAAEPLERNAA